MKATTLRKLAALAEARKTRDLARLEALAAERRLLLEEIADLAGIEARDAAEGLMPFPMMARRSAWAAAEVARREQRIAAIDREMEEARAAARTSLGKHEALLRLIETTVRDEEASRLRAEERASFDGGGRRPGI